MTIFSAVLKFEIINDYRIEYNYFVINGVYMQVFSFNFYFIFCTVLFSFRFYGLVSDGVELQASDEGLQICGS